MVFTHWAYLSHTILMITNVMFTPHLIVNLVKMNEFLLMLGLGNVHSSTQVIPDIIHYKYLLYRLM